MTSGSVGAGGSPLPLGASPLPLGGSPLALGASPLALGASPLPLAASPLALAAALDAQGYLADEGLSTAAFLAMTMGRPLFLEGDAGVGKTALAQALAAVIGVPLIRLQ